MEESKDELIIKEKTCSTCLQRINFECGITGKEIDYDTPACSSYEES